MFFFICAEFSDLKVKLKSRVAAERKIKSISNFRNI